MVYYQVIFDLLPCQNPTVCIAFHWRILKANWIKPLQKKMLNQKFTASTYHSLNEREFHF